MLSSQAGKKRNDCRLRCPHLCDIFFCQADIQQLASLRPPRRMLCLSLAASLAATVRRCRLHREQLHVACIAGGGAVAAPELDWACSAAAQDANSSMTSSALLDLVDCITLQPGDAATPQGSVAEWHCSSIPRRSVCKGPHPQGAVLQLRQAVLRPQLPPRVPAPLLAALRRSHCRLGRSKEHGACGAARTR